MFGKPIHLFSIFGFPIRIDVSWFLAAILVVWSLAAGLFPSYYANLSPATYWAMGIAGAVGLFASIVLHELGHAFVARSYGMSPRGITLFIFGGVAEMQDEPPSAVAEFLVSIAGPVVSLLLVGAGFALAALGGAIGWTIAVTGVLAWLAMINATLVLFNLVPAFPLDGGRVLRSLLWRAWGNLRRATRVTARIGIGFGFVLIGLGVVNLLFGNIFGAIWMAAIGWFLRNAAVMSYRQLLLRQSLEGQSVGEFISTSPVTVPAEMSVQQFIETYVYKYGQKLFPVLADDGRLAGYISVKQVKELPRSMHATRSVGEIMGRISEAHTILPNTDALAALEKMARAGLPSLLVVDGDHLVGTVDRSGMLRFASISAEIEGDTLETRSRVGPYERASAGR